METASPSPSPDFSQLPSGAFRGVFADAIRFWEPRRIAYNIALAVVVVAWLAATWPHFRPAFTLSSLLPLTALAAIANACYCAAYLVDIPMQHSSFAAVWRRRRWGLWVLGMLLAILLANYWIVDEIYPFVR